MKRILYITTIIFCFGVVSCKKFLNTTPTDSLSQVQYYDSETKLNEALAGVYQPLAATTVYGSAFTGNLLISDENYYAFTPSASVTYGYDYSSPDINNFWKQCYIGIERANTLIKNINIAPMDENKRQVILGETLFLRGYYYFLLVSSFGDVPLKTVPTPSVIEVNIPRTPTKQVYAQILADMTAAETKVSSITTLGYSGHVSTTAIDGILARVCLQMAGYPLYDDSKYADALAWAKKVQAAGVHSLNPSYQQIFVNLMQNVYDTKESLWEIEETGNGTEGFGSVGALGVANGISLSTNGDIIGYSSGAINATSKLYNVYAPGDLRRDWAIAPFSYNATTTPVSYNYWTPDKIYTRNEGKYRREADLSTNKSKNVTSTNFPVLRYADVLLMLAEAENHINGPSQVAYDAINQVRRRAFGLNPNTPSTSVSVVSGLTLSTTGNTGYLATVPNIPLTITGGGGTGATAAATVATTGKITGITVTNPGKGYTSAPTVTAGTLWAANTAYLVGSQVINGNNLYTVTTAGTSTMTGPTQSSGSSQAATTGAVFTYAGVKASITATVATVPVDLAGLNQATFLQALQDERFRELCFEATRKSDLIRWGIWVSTMNNFSADVKANPSAFQYAALPGANITSRNLLFPIPSSEITVNRAMTQNPGW